MHCCLEDRDRWRKHLLRKHRHPQPSLTFLVNGAPASSDWLSGTPVVTVIGGETGGILSGLKQISCSVDGGAPFTFSGVDAASDYTSSFELQQNGADQVSDRRHGCGDDPDDTVDGDGQRGQPELLAGPVGADRWWARPVLGRTVPVPLVCDTAVGHDHR